MIIAKGDIPLTILEHPSTPEERARALADRAEYQKNVDWFGTNAAAIRDAHAGRFVCVLGQELFVGDDPVEVMARAKAAHPELAGGSFSLRVSTHRGPKIYAS